MICVFGSQYQSRVARMSVELPKAVAAAGSRSRIAHTKTPAGRKLRRDRAPGAATPSALLPGDGFRLGCPYQCQSPLLIISSAERSSQPTSSPYRAVIIPLPRPRTRPVSDTLVCPYAVIPPTRRQWGMEDTAQTSPGSYLSIPAYQPAASPSTLVIHHL